MNTIDINRLESVCGGRDSTAANKSSVDDKSNAVHRLSPYMPHSPKWWDSYYGLTSR
jgi:hypothetical protein